MVQTSREPHIITLTHLGADAVQFVCACGEGQVGTECPHGNGLSCRECQYEAEAEDATWD